MGWTQAYHCTVKHAIGRANGKSAIAKAAYNAREKLRDERTGQLKDYSRTNDNVLFSGIFADPKRNAPEWIQDRAALWNAASAAEKRKDAREAQEIILALPHQLTQEQREFIVKDFAREHITRSTGRIADVNIHRPPNGGDERNDHAHILMTLREIGPEGFGAKLPEIDQKQISKWREKWAQRCARELRKAGFELEADRWAVGHLSKEQQREDALRRNDREHIEWCDLDATKHLGPTASAMDRKAPGSSERANIEREKLTASIEAAKLRRELAEIGKQITEIERGSPERMERITPQRMPSGLTGTSAQIWAAYNIRSLEHAHEARQFADALAQNGIRLAVVTKRDVHRSHREAAFAKEIGTYARVYREGEFVAVNRYGDVYRLNERNTGADAKAVQHFLQKAQLPDLPSMGAIRDTAKQERDAEKTERQKKAEQREIAWQKRRSEIVADRFGDKLIGRAVDTALRDPRQQHGEQYPSMAAFKDALEKNRLAFASVTPEEAAKSQRDREFAKELGGYAPVYKPGEIVLVREKREADNIISGQVYKVDQSKAEDYLRCAALDKTQLQGIGSTTRALQLGAFYARQKWTQRGGMYQQQMWALRRIKEARGGRRRSQHDDHQKDERQKQDDYTERQKRDSGQIDPERYRTDPDYRRQAQNTQAYKTPEEKKRDRENDARALLEQRER